MVDTANHNIMLRRHIELCPRMRNKEVQVIPWVVTDSNFVRCPSQKLDPGRTVFVGALHGMLTAEALSNIFNDLFGGVIYAGW